jgi:hypothetical protein
MYLGGPLIVSAVCHQKALSKGVLFLFVRPDV